MNKDKDIFLTQDLVSESDKVESDNNSIYRDKAENGKKIKIAVSNPDGAVAGIYDGFAVLFLRSR